MSTSQAKPKEKKSAFIKTTEQPVGRSGWKREGVRERENPHARKPFPANKMKGQVKTSPQKKRNPPYVTQQQRKRKKRCKIL
jgi:hypothetical protein